MRNGIQEARSSLHRVSEQRTALPTPPTGILTEKKSKIAVCCLTWVSAHGDVDRGIPSGLAKVWKPNQGQTTQQEHVKVGGGGVQTQYR